MTMSFPTTQSLVWKPQKFVPCLHVQIAKLQNIKPHPPTGCLLSHFLLPLFVVVLQCSHACEGKPNSAWTVEAFVRWTVDPTAACCTVKWLLHKEPASKTNCVWKRMHKENLQSLHNTLAKMRESVQTKKNC
jgi:hypothetical protein